ncbi:MAG: phosphoribosylamine--glycine ligase [Muribaculaceae bacterium]|nr:phosphoribosylamine--glycine ligase [Muribaculaceae bacterium]
MNVLLLGSGGRECALAWKMNQSELLDNLYIAPGNAGTAALGTNLPQLSPMDFEAVGKAAVELGIDLLVVGNEDPLVAGITDYVKGNEALKHIKVVGPSQAGAQLEGSKDFAKEFMNRHGIPTAQHISVTASNIEEGYAFLDKQQAPYVLKADGLAAGKGVLIIDDLDEAKAELKAMLDGMFGASSATVVIEQFLSGIECSVFVLTDDRGSYALLPVAKDYKRVGEGDTGPNTGGMGSISPVSFADAVFMDKVRQRIIEPTINGLKQDGISYCGFVFFGLINVGGEPYVIEYNVRMGDPETQSVMARVDQDLIALMLQATGEQGFGESFTVKADERTAATVIMTSGGYPGKYEKGKEITGLDAVEGSVVFHAGTSLNVDGQLVTSGGRVLAVTSLACDKDAALALSYGNVARIAFDGSYCRRDIGFDL